MYEIPSEISHKLKIKEKSTCEDWVHLVILNTLHTLYWFIILLFTQNENLNSFFYTLSHIKLMFIKFFTYLSLLYAPQIPLEH